MQKNYPSVKTIQKIKGVDFESAILARLIMQAKSREELEVLDLSVYKTYWQKTGQQMYNPHSLNELKMQLLDIVLNGYGVEGHKVNKKGDYVEYINFGDSYDMTVLLFQNRFIVSCWGDNYSGLSSIE